MKIKLLDIITKILKLKKYKLKLAMIPLPLLWKEMIGICTRAAKDAAIGSESLNSKLFESLLFFLHGKCVSVSVCLVL